MRRRIEFERLVESSSGCNGAGSDDNTSYVEQRFAAETAAALYSRNYQTVQRKSNEHFLNSLKMLVDTR